MYWTGHIFSEYAGDISNVPQNVRIINYPFYDRYRKELYLLGGLFVFSFILVTISLLRTHRRSLMERKNLQMLEEAHKRLTLSMNGGKFHFGIFKKVFLNLMIIMYDWLAWNNGDLQKRIL